MELALAWDDLRERQKCVRGRLLRSGEASVSTPLVETLEARPERASDAETRRRSLEARKEERAAAGEVTVAVPELHGKHQRHRATAQPIQRCESSKFDTSLARSLLLIVRQERDCVERVS
jgi:hypothetical protein